jgi:hypothetical protein
LFSFSALFSLLPAVVLAMLSVISDNFRFTDFCVYPFCFNFHFAICFPPSYFLISYPVNISLLVFLPLSSVCVFPFSVSFRTFFFSHFSFPSLFALQPYASRNLVQSYKCAYSGAGIAGI